MKASTLRAATSASTELRRLYFDLLDAGEAELAAMIHEANDDVVHVITAMTKPAAEAVPS